ncbi:MAG: leucine--tRNA ligase [Dissulfurispiraceae bacterium]
MTERYDFKAIEAKWQEFWSQRALNRADVDAAREKFYCLEMFPYPSGKIHMGHVRNYAIGDVIARYKRMQGFNVLHPMGWDAFGLPAENAAIKHNIHPAKWTHENIEYMKVQLNRLGLSYDWRREVTTCNPEYYRWNQWIFLNLYKRGLAYKKASFVNWCPSCATVLANEQVTDEKCWRCDSLVVQKELEQWFFKITHYAEELLRGCEELKGWPERVVAMQKNWIGRSEGVEVDFLVEGLAEKITIFTTRSDTVFGATFVCLAPGHPILEKMLKEMDQIESLREKYGKMEVKEGFFTGYHALNPLTQERIPIYVANFVLMEYGSGAIMSVPAHDQRDFDFAEKYDLPIKVVVVPGPLKSSSSAVGDDNGQNVRWASEHEIRSVISKAYEDDGILVNSGEFSGLKSEGARREIGKYLEEKGLGKIVVHYKLRDWGISRQRYWGTPIPIIYCKSCGIIPVPEDDLPVILPEDVIFTGIGGSPLSESDNFLLAKCPQCGGYARRETDTMDTFVDSSWYFIAYCFDKGTIDLRVHEGAPRSALDYWMPVDQYVGGIEHAVLHLLYSRFFTRAMRDLGVIRFDEPFSNLLTQGMVCKETWRCSEHDWLFPHEVKDMHCVHCGSSLERGRIEKMSKSRKNVVDPDILIRRYGADTIRLFSLFAAPPERDLEWSDQGVEGAHRFLNKVWGFVFKNKSNFHYLQYSIDDSSLLQPRSLRLLRQTHQTIKKVTNDIEKDYHFNTAIAALMELMNSVSSFNPETEQEWSVLKFTITKILLMLAPFAPHISEELWSTIGETSSVVDFKWPLWDENLATEEEIELIIQINGKLRAKMLVPANLSDEEARQKALKEPKIKQMMEGKKINKVVVVKGRLVNIVGGA